MHQQMHLDAKQCISQTGTARGVAVFAPPWRVWTTFHGVHLPDTASGPGVSTGWLWERGLRNRRGVGGGGQLEEENIYCQSWFFCVTAFSWPSCWGLFPRRAPNHSGLPELELQMNPHLKLQVRSHMFGHLLWSEHPWAQSPWQESRHGRAGATALATKCHPPALSLTKDDSGFLCNESWTWAFSW